MAVLIDSSLLIAHERGSLDLSRIMAERVTGRENEPFYLSVASASELLHGVHRAAEPGRRARRGAFVEAVLERFPLLPIDLPTARTHAELWSALAAAGTPVGAHDLWIAATAVSRGLTVVTANVREFERVPGLDVESWQA